MRWMLLLQDFDFKMFHKLGKENLEANFLCRSIAEEETNSMQDMPADAELVVVLEEPQREKHTQD